MPEDAPIVELPPSETTLLGTPARHRGRERQPNAAAAAPALRARARARAVRDLPGRPPARAHGNHASRPVARRAARPERYAERRGDPRRTAARARTGAHPRGRSRGRAAHGARWQRARHARSAACGRSFACSRATRRSRAATRASPAFHSTKPCPRGLRGSPSAIRRFPRDWTPERYLLESARLAGFREPKRAAKSKQALTRFELSASARRRLADSYVAVKRVVLLAHATLGAPQRDLRRDTARRARSQRARVRRRRTRACRARATPARIRRAPRRRRANASSSARTGSCSLHGGTFVREGPPSFALVDEQPLRGNGDALGRSVRRGSRTSAACARPPPIVAPLLIGFVPRDVAGVRRVLVELPEGASPDAIVQAAHARRRAARRASSRLERPESRVMPGGYRENLAFCALRANAGARHGLERKSRRRGHFAFRAAFARGDEGNGPVR